MDKDKKSMHYVGLGNFLDLIISYLKFIIEMPRLLLDHYKTRGHIEIEILAQLQQLVQISSEVSRELDILKKTKIEEQSLFFAEIEEIKREISQNSNFSSQKADHLSAQFNTLDFRLSSFSDLSIKKFDHIVAHLEKFDLRQSRTDEISVGKFDHILAYLDKLDLRQSTTDEINVGKFDHITAYLDKLDLRQSTTDEINVGKFDHILAYLDKLDSRHSTTDEINVGKFDHLSNQISNLSLRSDMELERLDSINSSVRKSNKSLFKNIDYWEDREYGPNYDIALIAALPTESAHDNIVWLPKSKAQLRQDLFVLAELNYKRKGFFVEFGAADGLTLSNTFLLEKYFDWSGILSEPAKVWHNNLFKNRKCSISQKCVWLKSGSNLQFTETKIPELSSLKKYIRLDINSELREEKDIYDVETISLEDLLVKYDAPKKIDYLSIDTEGSEFEILSNFNFSKFQIKIITCEHNFGPNREKIFDLLSSHGYVRKYTELSEFDDWYVLS